MFFLSYAHGILINSSFTLKILVKILTVPIQDTKARVLQNLATNSVFSSLQGSLTSSSVDSQLIPDRHLGWQSGRSRLIVNQYISVSQHSVDCELAVEQALIKCWPSIDQEVNRVLIKVYRHSTEGTFSTHNPVSLTECIPAAVHLYVYITSTCSLKGSKRALTAVLVITTVPGSKPSRLNLLSLKSKI